MATLGDNFSQRGAAWRIAATVVSASCASWDPSPWALPMSHLNVSPGDVGSLFAHRVCGSLELGLFLVERAVDILLRASHAVHADAGHDNDAQQDADEDTDNQCCGSQWVAVKDGGGPLSRE